MPRRTKAARAFTAVLATALALGAATALPGCQHNRGGSRAVPNGIEYTVVVENDSKHAVDVAWSLAHRHQDSEALGAARERSLGVIAPGSTGHDGPMVAMTPTQNSADYVQVFRIRLTIPSASWQEPARMWWEVVGTLPAQFVIENGPGPDGFKVKLGARGAAGAAIEAVPRQLWPEEDQ